MTDEWKEMGNAPKDRQILLDVGLPWPVVGSWCMATVMWVYANFQISMLYGEDDAYFESEYEKTPKCWRELPKLRGQE
jgi:hypothetical protein